MEKVKPVRELKTIDDLSEKFWERLDKNAKYDPTTCPSLKRLHDKFAEARKNIIGK